MTKKQLVEWLDGLQFTKEDNLYKKKYEDGRAWVYCIKVKTVLFGLEDNGAIHYFKKGVLSKMSIKDDILVGLNVLQKTDD